MTMMLGRGFATTMLMFLLSYSFPAAAQTPGAPANANPVADVVEVPDIQPSEQPGPGAGRTVAAGNVPANQAAVAQRPINFPREAGDDMNVLKLQIFLDYHGYSVGEIDGRWGYNTGRALIVYQKNNSLPPTGQMDDRILARLDGFSDAYLLSWNLSAEDLKGPFSFVPRDYYEQSKMKWLPYEELIEKLGELFHISPTLLRKLNPGTDFARLQVGQRILVPNVANGIDEQRTNVAVVRISKHNKWTEAYDSAGRFVFYYPSTLGGENDPLPLGTWAVTGVTPNPYFTLKPSLFWDHNKNDPEALLPPGPNSPVGAVWIGTSRKSVGIHGTPNPGTISRGESHGCIRLTNWDARQLAARVKAGTKLEFIE